MSWRAGSWSATHLATQYNDLFGVHTSPGYPGPSGQRYPVIYLLQGLTGQVDMWWNRAALRPNMPERIDEWFATSSGPPALVVEALAV